MNTSSFGMTMKQDDAYDKKHGIKEDSPKDLKLDKKLVKPTPKNWIKGAVKHPGAFTASAKKASMSVPKFAAKEKNSSNPTLAKRANLALTFEKLAGKK
jgi:hypothetical protein